VIVDAHEDIAWNALTFGRDYTHSALATRALEANTPVPSQNGNSLLGRDEWVEGRVGLVFATLFSAPIRHRYGDWDILVYDDDDSARQQYLQNLSVYTRLSEEHPDHFRIVRDQEDLDITIREWGDPDLKEASVGMVLLMEGAEALRSPVELEEWHSAGIRIIGPAWSRTKYTGGTYDPGPLTDQGRELLVAMSEFSLILDVSHMSDEGIVGAVDIYDGTLIASHSNPRSLIPTHPAPERHLSDDSIRLIAARDGVIGVVIYNPFLKDGWDPRGGRSDVGIADVVACIDSICQLTGSADHVGFGSDFDGGFGVESIPAGLDTVADLRLIGNALANQGYSEGHVNQIIAENWIRILRQSLPEG
jgi:membrane dipeptidase